MNWTPEIAHRAQCILDEIGDDPGYFTLLADLTTLRARCRFACCEEALVARYFDLPFAAVAFYGQGEALCSALRALLDPGQPAYALVGAAQRANLEAVARVQEVIGEWQMVFRGDVRALDAGDAVALTAADWPAMRALAERGGATALEQNALDKGPYYGVWCDGVLASMAGTHLALDRVAEVGNVVTDPDCRRRGYASRAVVATTRALQAQGLQVILHVYQSNVGAVACYERLGFERTGEMQLVRFIVDRPGLGS